MKINKSSGRNKKKTAIFIALCLIVGASTWFLYFSRQTPTLQNTNEQSRGSNSVDYGDATDEQKKAGDEIKKQSIDADSDQTSSDSNKNNSQTTTKKNVQVSITSLDTQSSTTAAIRAEIETVVNSGTCTLVLSKEGSPTITKTSNVQASANISGCGAFNISGIAKGTWSASVSFDNDTMSGLTTQKVTIQ